MRESEGERKSIKQLTQSHTLHIHVHLCYTPLIHVYLLLPGRSRLGLVLPSFSRACSTIATPTSPLPSSSMSGRRATPLLNRVDNCPDLVGDGVERKTGESVVVVASHLVKKTFEVLPVD